MLPPDLPGDWLKRAAARCPARNAMVCSGKAISYGSLAARVRDLNSRVPEYGHRRGPAMPASAHRTDMALALHACLAAGHIALVHSPRSHQIFADRRCVQGSRTLNSESIQMCIATSGTTARPRFAMLSRGALAWSAHAVNERLQFDDSGAWLNCLPLHHIAGASILLRCLAARATMVLHERFDAESVLRDLTGRGITHISLVPAMLDRLLDAGDSGTPPPKFLRVALVGGGPLSRPLAERALALGWPLYVSWGMTETASAVTIARVDDTEWKPGHVGQPLPGICLDVRGSSNGEGPGTGRIRIRGPCLMSGYAAPGVAPPAVPGHRRFLSRDLGYLDARGALHLTGRADDMLVTGGENVHPERIESVLSACPGVRDVAISALADPVWGKRLVAVATGPVSLEALEDWSRKRLAGAQRPRGFVKVRQLPRNDLGKLDRKRIEQVLPGWIDK